MWELLGEKKKHNSSLAKIHNDYINVQYFCCIYTLAPKSPVTSTRALIQ